MSMAPPQPVDRFMAELSEHAAELGYISVMMGGRVVTCVARMNRSEVSWTMDSFPVTTELAREFLSKHVTERTTIRRHGN